LDNSTIKESLIVQQGSDRLNAQCNFTRETRMRGFYIWIRSCSLKRIGVFLQDLDKMSRENLKKLESVKNL